MSQKEIPLDPYAAENNLGPLPESGSGTLHIPETVPDGAKRWLIYTFVTVQGAEPPSGRAFYDFTSTEGDTIYHRFMNVAFVKDSVVNSMNVWIPANSSRALTVHLENAQIAQKRKRPPRSCGMAELLRTAEGTTTGAFVIAYEM